MRFPLPLLVLAACAPDGGLKVYNNPPEVAFTSPSDGASFAEGVDVTLAASVHDAQQGVSELTLAWNLSDGSVPEGVQTIVDGGVTFVATDLPAGEVVVTLTAVDNQSDHGEDSVTLHIVPDAVPTISFTAPLEGAVVAAEDRLRVDVQVADTDEADLAALGLTWAGTVDLAEAPANPDSSGGAAFYVSGLTAGTQEIEVTVTDSLGATASGLVGFEAVLADADLDGHRSLDWGGDDCDDAAPDVYPGADERCNGVDDDCDGVIDEDDAVDAPTWYEDFDGDGFGDATSARAACDAPVGFVEDDTDCDDGDAAVNAGAEETCDGADQDCDGDVDEDAPTAPEWYADTDGDGYGDAASPLAACDTPAGHVADDTDCDDADVGVNPAAPETCDGEDDDCDGTIDEDDAADAPTWYVDVDGDGFGGATTTRACSQPAGAYPSSDDCDDSDAAESPDALESCDGDDDDCDGVVDEDDAVDAATWYADSDGDAHGDATRTSVACDAPTGYVGLDDDCDDADAAIHPDAPETDCADPVDYNCDGATGFSDRDGDGWAACEECDDALAAVNPDATEVCNEDDDDCDGVTDEDDAADAAVWYADADGDGYGDPTVTAVACDAPAGFVADDTDCDDTDASNRPGGAEVCDGDDDDCDGTVDEDDAADVRTWYADTDGDGFGDAAAADIDCDQPVGFIADDTDCDDGDAGVSPADLEFCDGEDDDCDGAVDEDDAVDAPTWYADADADAYGDAAVSAAACAAPSGFVADDTDCDDTASDIHPGASERCNGEDDDCDSVVDEDDAVDALTWYADSDGDSYGSVAVSAEACAAPAGYVADDTDCDDAVSAVNPGATELCNDLDDDCDGTTDESDAADVATWYADADADGYGTPGTTAAACDTPVGYVANSDDCDDTDAGVSPADLEYCDGEDDDCDGTVDEDGAVDATTWYADADTDGHGSAATSHDACAMPTGYAANATDCDDTDAGVSPADLEYCDGEDDDCDGVVDEDDAVDAPTWYADTDSDGHGDPYAPRDACSAPAAHVAIDDDCDDTDPYASPSALEYCDDEDDDCDGTIDESDAVDAGTWYLDNDGDDFGQTGVTLVACDEPAGYAGEADDCDDSNAFASPFADEYCNSIDDDCDGTTDEDDAVDAPTWYADTDSDSYGNASSPRDACAAPSGYVANGDDCNDATSAISPADAEVCDTSDTDEDCDGLADDADASATGKSTFYADSDGDGHAGATTSSRCDGTSAWLATSTDCDDTSSGVNPDATEVCDAADTDEDCDGVADDEGASGCTTFYVDSDRDGAGGDTSACLCEAGGGYTSTSSNDCDDSSTAVGPSVEEVAANGIDDDCDGDTDEAGIEWPVDANYCIRDVATYTSVGATSTALIYQRGMPEGGEDWDGDGYEEFVVAPGTSGYAYIREARGTSASVSSITSLSGLYGAVALIDDQDGDGLKEGLFGAYTTSTYGRVYLLGTADMGVNASVSSAANTTFTASSPVDDFGYLVGNVGDMFGDGVGDMLISAPIGSNQKVFIFDGPVATGSVSSTTAAVTFTHATASVYFGYAAESDGDFDGDGVPDVAIGAYGESTSAGKVYVFDGATASGTVASTSAEAVLSGGASSDRFGFQLDVADDLNGDGLDDLVVGAYGAGTYGAAYVFLGPISTASVTSADLTLDGDSGDAADFGYTVEAIGDFDADGDKDIAVGAPSNTGEVALFSWDGSAGTLYPEDAFARFDESVSGYSTGYSVGLSGDLDADGYRDMLIYGAYSGTSAYRAYVVHANFRRVMASGASTTEVIDATGNFSHSVAGAGDFNADGYADMAIGAMYAGTTGSGLLYLGPFGEREYTTAYDGQFTGNATADDIGTSVAGGADFDGDIYDDLVVGGPLVDDIGANAGAVYVFGGAATGYSSAASGADAAFYGAATGDYFGWSVAVMDDWDGDTYSELLVGAPYNDSSGTDSGRAYLYSAPFASTGEVAITTFTAESAGDYLGNSVHGGGDVDGDGFEDVVLGAPYDDDVSTDSGAAYVFTSAPVGTTPVSSADTKITGEARLDYAGTSVAIVGDVDGDGYDDIAVGAPGNDDGAASGGNVYVVLGPPSSGAVSLSAAYWSLPGESTSLVMGTEVAPAGDLNGDGLADLLFSGSLLQDYSRMGAVHGPLDGRLPFYFYYWDDAGTRRGIAGIGDQDGDGFDDFAITGTYEENYGRVYVQKGR